MMRSCGTQALPDGRYEIGVHIADVSHFVRRGTALDAAAAARATSVYMVQVRTATPLPASSPAASSVPWLHCWR